MPTYTIYHVHLCPRYVLDMTPVIVTLNYPAAIHLCIGGNIGTLDVHRCYGVDIV